MISILLCAAAFLAPPDICSPAVERGDRVSEAPAPLVELPVDQAGVITLAGKGLPLSRVLAELSKQTGNAVMDHREAFGQLPEDMPIDAAFEGTPFWQALDNVLDQADLTLFGFAGQRGVFIINRLPDAGKRSDVVSYAGAFRVAPVRIEAIRDFRTETSSGLRILLELAWEPRIQPFSIIQIRRGISAIAESGSSIATAGEEPQRETIVRPDFPTIELEVPLVLPPQGTSEIKLLKGQLTALVPGVLEEFRFSDLALSESGAAFKRITQRRDGSEITLESVRKNNEVWEARVRMQFDVESEAIQSHRSWLLENEAYFEDSAGKRIPSGGLEQTLRTKDALGLTYYFDLPEGSESLTFVYRTPLKVIELAVPYEFHDLQLP